MYSIFFWEDNKFQFTENMWYCSFFSFAFISPCSCRLTSLLLWIHFSCECPGKSGSFPAPSVFHSATAPHNQGQSWYQKSSMDLFTQSIITKFLRERCTLRGNNSSWSSLFFFFFFHILFQLLSWNGLQTFLCNSLWGWQYCLSWGKGRLTTWPMY